ncbi:MAG: glycosyltransferase family protein [Aureispira sp.]
MKKKILIGVNGWGRGHSTRCAVIGQQLLELGYEVKFLTDFQGYDYLSQRYDTSQLVKVRSYRPITIGESVNVLVNVLAAAFFKFVQLPLIARKTMSFIRDWQPDLIITDAELVTGKLVKKLQIPSIYLSSISYLNYCQLPFELSFTQRIYVRLFNWGLSDCTSASLIIISKMSQLQLREGVANNVHLLDIFLRKELEQNSWNPQGTHLLVYLRGTYIKRILKELEIVGKQLQRKVFVYGIEDRKDTEYLTFKPISDQHFMMDMLTADYVINTSGNQLIGELAYIGVPALLLPEIDQFEQHINSILADDFYDNMTRGDLKTIKAPEIIAQLRTLKGKPHPHLKANAGKAVALITAYIEGIGSDSKPCEEA